MISTVRQTNESIVGIDFEDFLSFSRNEPLHLLPDAHVVNDEEYTLLSSIFHNWRKHNSLVQCRSNSFFPIGTVLGEEPAGSILCGFVFAFARHAKSFASNFNAYSSS